MNLRGVKESGTLFAIPTYGFIAVAALFIGGLIAALSGHPIRAESANLPIDTPPDRLRPSCCSCCVVRFRLHGVDGVEAVSNGVPFFRKPKSRNAALTLVAMWGTIAISMFAGVTWLAISSGVKFAENPAELGLPADAVQPTVIAQLGMAVFGSSGIGFYLLKAFTAAILILAANTAFNGFPVLASILGETAIFLGRWAAGAIVWSSATASSS